MSANQMFDLLGMDKLSAPKPIDEQPQQPRVTKAMRQVLPTIPAASPEDQFAREVVAEIEREDDFDSCAWHRLRGAYDGDTEHRIALAAIRRWREQDSEQCRKWRVEDGQR